jgi:hypothetical protein
MDTSHRTKSRAGTVSRRSFMKIGGALGVVAAAGGLEGILLAKTPPAYAQGSMLHWVRWVDFIPEADVELRRQVAEASKDLGAQIQLETINGNDIQARITASIQSGSGADIFMMMYNWPQLYANALVNVSDIVTAVEKDQGTVYGIYPPSADVRSTWRAVPHALHRRQRHRVPEIVVQGGRGVRSVHADQDPGGSPPCDRPVEEEGEAVRADAGAHLRRRADVDISAHLGFRRRRDRHHREKGGPRLQGDPGGRALHDRLLEG